MRDRVEVTLEVRIHDVDEAFVQRGLDLLQGVMTPSAMSKAGSPPFVLARRN